MPTNSSYSSRRMGQPSGCSFPFLRTAATMSKGQEGPRVRAGSVRSQLDSWLVPSRTQACVPLRVLLPAHLLFSDGSSRGASSGSRPKNRCRSASTASRLSGAVKFSYCWTGRQGVLQRVRCGCTTTETRPRALATQRSDMDQQMQVTTQAATQPPPTHTRAWRHADRQ